MIIKICNRVSRSGASGLMLPACGAAGREDPPHPPPSSNPARGHLGGLLVPLWPAKHVGAASSRLPAQISRAVPLFIFMGNFTCPPPSPARSLPEARSRPIHAHPHPPPAAPTRACCGVTPGEGAEEWSWRERLFPGAQRHSHELNEPRTEKGGRWETPGGEGGGGGGEKKKRKKKKRENRWEKSCGVQAKFAFWLEVWSGSNLLSHCASCPRGSSAAAPLPGQRDPPAERWRGVGGRGGGQDP